MGPGCARPLDLLLPLLAKVKRTKGGWSARCPAHDDNAPSLAIKEGDDGRALVKCHAGCSFEQICAALHLQPKDLFPSSASPGAAAPEFETAEQAIQSVTEFIRRNGAGWELTYQYSYTDQNGREI